MLSYADFFDRLALNNMLPQGRRFVSRDSCCARKNSTLLCLSLPD